MLLGNDQNKINEYKDIVKKYDYNSISSEMLFYEHRNHSTLILKIYNLLEECKYSKDRDPKLCDEFLLDLILNTDSVTFKCILYEKLNERDPYEQKYKKSVEDSIIELLKFLPNANTFAPSNRIEVLLRVIAEESATYIKKKFKEFFALIKNIYKSNNIYLARTFYSMIKILQDADLASKEYYDYARKIIDQSFSESTLTRSDFDVYENIYDFLKDNYKPKSEIALQYAQYVMKNKSIFHFIERQDKLRKATNYMVLYSDNKILINDFKLELDKANKEVLNSMSSREINPGNNIVKAIKKQDEAIINMFKGMSSLKAFFTIIFEIKLLSKEEIKNNAENFKSNSFIFSTIPTIPIDSKTGKVIESKEPNELIAWNTSFNILLQYEVLPLILGFINTFSVDDMVEKFIEEMLVNNPICKDSKVSTLKKAIIGILNGDYSTHLNNLIASFEDGLKYFLENENISTTEFKRGYQSKIDLNDILRDEPDNIYKQKLLEYLTNDTVDLLYYLCVSNQGYNIRNNVMHGDFEDKDYNSVGTIYLAFIIIVIYFGFYCNKKET